MTPRVLPALVLALLPGPLAFAAPPLVPTTEEWPPIEPALVVADGYQPTGAAEYQWRNDTWEPTHRQELAYDTQARLESVRRQSWFMDAWRVEHRETMTYDDTGRLVAKIRQEAVGIALHNRGRSTYDHREAGTIRVDLAGWSHEQRWMPMT